MNSMECIRQKWDLGTHHPVRSKSRFLVPALMVLVIFTVGSAVVNPAYGQSSSRSEGELEEDFRFSAPKGFIGFRVGKFFPQANSDLFDFITDELTLEKNDFRAWNMVIDGGVSLNNRVELVFGMEYMKRTKYSEFRDWVDDQGLPITQKTYYSQLPLTVGVKLLLIPRGRRIGRYAWLPSRVVPYVGAGVGTQWYRFGQSGDFVDFETLDIFYAELESSGWTATAYASGGVDIRIARNTYVVLDLRYSWANPEPNGYDYVGFETLDLDGIRATAGLQWHF